MYFHGFFTKLYIFFRKVFAKIFQYFWLTTFVYYLVLKVELRFVMKQLWYKLLNSQVVWMVEMTEIVCMIYSFSLKCNILQKYSIVQQLGIVWVQNTSPSPYSRSPLPLQTLKYLSFSNPRQPLPLHTAEQLSTPHPQNTSPHSRWPLPIPTLEHLCASAPQNNSPLPTPGYLSPTPCLSKQMDPSLKKWIPPGLFSGFTHFLLIVFSQWPLGTHS